MVLILCSFRLMMGLRHRRPTSLSTSPSTVSRRPITVSRVDKARDHADMTPPTVIGSRIVQL